MIHGEFGFYSNCSGHLVRIDENMEITCSALRDKMINLAEAAIDSGARIKAREPILKRTTQAQN